MSAAAPTEPELVQLADGPHRTYARVTSRTARDVVVTIAGERLTFELATGRRRSPRVFLPPYRLAAPAAPTAPTAPGDAAR